MDCGYSFDEAKDNIFTNGKIFLVIIAIVVILGLIVIATSGNGDNFLSNDSTYVDLTISDVNGYEGENSGKTTYTLYTSVLFSDVTGDINDYKLKTTYYDASGKEIGHVLSSLKDEYSDSEYGTYVGYYTTYKMPHPDYVVIEILKDGEVVDKYNESINQNKIKFLN